MMETSGRLETLQCDEISLLIEQEIADEILTSDEQRSIAEHLKACATCREVVSVTRSLHMLADAPTEKALDAAVGNILVQLRPVQGDPERVNQAASKKSVHSLNKGISARPVWHWLAAAAVVILAVGGGILYKMSGDKNWHPSDVKPVDCSVTNARMIGDGVEMVACGQNRSAVQVTDSGEVWVTLKKGVVALHVDPNRTRKAAVWVETRAARVQVKGTVFGVYVDGAESGVEVFRGVVAVYPSAHQEVHFDVTEGEHAGFQDTASLPLKKGARTRVLAKSLKTVSSDDLIVQGKMPAQQLSSADADELGESTPESGAGPTDASFELEDAGPEGSVPVRPGVVVPAGVSVDELLQRAQLSLIDADWQGAAGWYQKVLRQYPGSPQAATVRISLARLELRHLGRPERALKHYKAYHKRSPNGPLAEEALFGIAESYRSLGAIDRERQALQRFIEQFSGSTLSNRVRKRLNQLSVQPESQPAP